MNKTLINNMTPEEIMAYRDYVPTQDFYKAIDTLIGESYDEGYDAGRNNSPGDNYLFPDVIYHNGYLDGVEDAEHRPLMQQGYEYES